MRYRHSTHDVNMYIFLSLYITRNNSGMPTQVHCSLFPIHAERILDFMFLFLHFSLLGMPFHPSLNNPYMTSSFTNSPTSPPLKVILLVYSQAKARTEACARKIPLEKTSAQTGSALGFPERRKSDRRTRSRGSQIGVLQHCLWTLCNAGNSWAPPHQF